MNVYFLPAAALLLRRNPSLASKLETQWTPGSISAQRRKTSYMEIKIFRILRLFRNSNLSLCVSWDTRDNLTDLNTWSLLNIWQHQQMHASTIYVFFLLVSSYMFRRCRHLYGAYTKISLKHTGKILYNKHTIVVMSIVQVLFRILLIINYYYLNYYKYIGFD
jgi:hypothetical protein